MAIPRVVILLCLILLTLGYSGCSSENGECVGAEDSDCDGSLNASDNCPEIFNSSQVDSDADGIGDVCEPIPCGDGICDPEGGECDIFIYCKADCTQSLCFGLSEGETCGDGFCQPLAGECADSDPCLEDCPDPNFFCFPGTCGDRICQPWEDDPEEETAFCFFDCACAIEKRVEDACEGNIDCLDQPGKVCGPEDFPSDGDGEPDFGSIACICTACGNGILDSGEDCDASAEFAGLEECFNRGGFCNDLTCECILHEFNCEDQLDNDQDGMVDCEDSECLIMPGCGGGGGDGGGGGGGGA